MTEKTPATLDRLWEELPTGHAPIGDLLSAGRDARRRRRRTAVAAVAAATAFILGFGFLVNLIQDHGDALSAADARGLHVRVQVGTPERVAALLSGSDEDAGVWDPRARQVVYVSRFGYSSSCPPRGTAAVADDGVLALELTDEHGDSVCTADAVQVTATITGLTEAPTELRVTDGSSTRTVPVVGAAADAGTKLVGIGHVSVAVPVSWADDAASCNTPVKDTVFFPWPQDCPVVRTRAVSSVAITTHEFLPPGTLDALKPSGRVDDHQVVESAPNCLQGYSDSGRTGSTHCTQTFGIPDLDAYFTASIVGDNADSRLATIRRSLRVLPEGQVAVPFVTPGSTLDDVRSALEEAGLSATVVEWTCPATADCVGDGVTGVEPGFGSVVPAGSAVTVRVLVWPDTPIPSEASCGPNDVCEDLFTLDCQGSSFVQATFDAFDETAAYATPHQAVAPMLAPDETASAPQDVDRAQVRLALLRADGTTRGAVTVEKTRMGWRPYTISGCSGESLAQDRR